MEEPQESERPASLTPRDIDLIERGLGVRLPAPYAAFLQNRDAHPWIDDTTMWDDAQGIIEATHDQRQGVDAWPTNWVCAGDEADICYYAVDCDTGRVVQTDKGSMTKPPLEEHESFAAFAAKATDPEAVVEAPPGPWWLDFILDHLGWVALFFFFVVMPFCAFCVIALWRWLTGQPI